MKKEMKLEFDALPENEGFARVAVSAFLTSLNPTLEEVEDVKTAVSEAVTNCIIHGYGLGYETILCQDKEPEEHPIPKVYISCTIEKDTISIEIKDTGVGIENIKQAMEPLFTTKPELERSGMGFAFMEAFMDRLFVDSALGKGTIVRMEKKCGYSPRKVDEE
ncbi:MAG: anti-sigma F factor [Lachnospiraceae bacterium]|nr:anti-sigma F factor [Lachnospiraceae bacterium]